MFNICNRCVNDVHQQMHEFQINDDGHDSICVNFFDEYNYHESIEEYPVLNATQQQNYINFLAQNSSRINRIEISINIDEEELPYDFLGQCLSQLHHVKSIMISCPPNEDDEPYEVFEELGNTLNKLACFEYVESLEFELNGLHNEQNDYDAHAQSFVAFIKSCLHLRSFKIISYWMSDYELISHMFDVLAENNNLREADFTFQFFDFEALSTLFRSKSIETLRIKLSGLGDLIDENDNLIPPHIQIHDFTKKLPIYSPLRHLTLDFFDISFTDYERKDYILSCNAFMPISLNRSLESLKIVMPSFYAQLNHHRLASERLSWGLFVQNLSNSSMKNIDLPSSFFSQFNQELMAQVTERNKKKFRELAFASNLLTGHLHPNFQGSFFQQVPDSRLIELDTQLCRVNLIQTHLIFLQNINIFSGMDFNIYKHFCVRMFAIITGNNTYDASFAPEMASYLGIKELAIILQTSKMMRGTLKDMRSSYQSALTNTMP